MITCLVKAYGQLPKLSTYRILKGFEASLPPL